MKAFMAHTREVAGSLEDALRTLDTDVRVALLHYAAVEATLRGERLEIYPFLGSYLLAEAVDRAGADLVVHGHAHNGTERGVTPGGVPVRNVAQPVLRRSYAVYCFGPDRLGRCDGGDEASMAAASR
jgi:Icc-related predicted phosphoesterase